MPKMNVTREFFAQCIGRAVVDIDGKKYVDPEKLSSLSGVRLASAKLRLSQWREKYRESGRKDPFPPTLSEGRGGKKLDLDSLALWAAEFVPTERDEFPMRDDPENEGEE